MSVAWDDMSKAEQALVNRYEKMADPDFLERQAARQAEARRMDAFVAERNLDCFECHSRHNRWAKTGVTNGRAWAICQPCIWKPRA